MLAALLLAGLFAAPIATVALFLPTSRRPRRDEKPSRRLAPSWWRHVLGSDGRSGPQALSLAGATIDPAPSRVFLMAGAAGATAAGDVSAARALQSRATKLALEDPTYYGDAWVALGPALLERSLDPCSHA